MSDEVVKVELESPDLAAEKLAAFQDLFPGVLADGILDAGRLGELLDTEVAAPADGRERFGLMWAGKQGAVRSLLAPSRGALLPEFDKSTNFDEARHTFIEGDNLEVLKLLQKAYNDKIKLIYIDPPYNTGNDFVYPDDFSDGLTAYLEFTGQLDETGNRRSAAVDSVGRLHSRWLSMMYPRLVLARNLLTQDGVLAVSIDDNEFANLRALLDEIFGPECFMGTLVWRRRQTPDSRNKSRVSSDHEYVLLYGRSLGSALRGADIDLTKYKNPDDDPRGPWTSENLTGLADAKARPNLHYDIVDPETGRAYPPHPDRGWAKAKATVDALIAEGRILFPRKPDGRPREKKFLADLRSERTGFSTWLESDVAGYNYTATRELTKLLGGKFFDFPKPLELVRTLVDQVTEPGDLVLDFFAGSGTTGQAVLELDSEGGSGRRFVLVQLPEPTDAGPYSSIAELTRARLSACAAEVKESGLRSFRLSPSCFRDETSADPEDLFDLRESTLDDGDHVMEELAGEILLKEGVALDARWTRDKADSAEVISADGVAVVLSLDVTEAVASAAIALEPRVLVFLEDGFAGRDAVKTNAFTNAKNLGITVKTV
ncbi:adenine-specific DNA-methyltransferase [Nocardioides cavernae]|uniref:Adenine-specific DNA-methyltransferase n=1 Tax=Nocardioides cavernae TaxID=1921566 RepID=A0A7Y9H690_9ACTN|nr:site-specific DNA-methyltransferase [Nocardioides cavernae]NYE38660.1 adenine-specific DNA-methyltransferase [Nocardioides cavernae]